jgi:hypothetical protein
MMTGVPVMVASERGRRNDGEGYRDADCFHSKKHSWLNPPNGRFLLIESGVSATEKGQRLEDG